MVNGVTEGMSPLYTQQFYCVPVLFPAPAEQRTILAQLREMTYNEDAAVARTEREIELLREYRTRLISDVVTGKLDVREAAASLPEEVPVEIDTLDNTATLDEADLAEEEAAA